MKKSWNKCPSDEHSKKKSSSLSSTILDYYNKYGQNRDLEKYLRFRKYGRSSSGESSSLHLSPEHPDIVEAKSLENLSIIHSNLDFNNKLQKSRSNESLSTKKSARNTDEKILSGKPKELSKSADEGQTHKQLTENASSPKVEDVKIQIKNAHKSKRKKSYNVNMESNIEISFPQPNQIIYRTISNPEIFPTNNVLSTVPVRSILESSETQTDFSLIATSDTNKTEFPETPLRPLKKQTNLKCPPVVAEDVRPTSAASSSASISNKQRLEWDSMADVGYDKSTEASSKSLDYSLTTFERATLKKFFAERGLSFDENIIVVGTKKMTNIQKLNTQEQEVKDRENCDFLKTKQTKDKWENAFRKILEEKHTAESVKKSKSEPSIAGRQLWESALKKFRYKYGGRINESDLCITNPEIHSTPIMAGPQLKPDISKGAIPKTKKIIAESMPHVKSVATNTLDCIDQSDKSCQTNMVSVRSTECQVESSISRGL